MTDDEINERCMLAVGWKHLGAVGVAPPKRGEADPPGLWCLSGGNDWWTDPKGASVCGRCESLPVPLTDDAEAMALVKHFGISLRKTDPDMWHAWIPLLPADGEGDTANRAICECVASIGSTSTTTPRD